jgi:acetyl esterase/lipase
MKSTATAILLAFVFTAPSVRSAEKPTAPKAAEKVTPTEAPASRKATKKGQDGKKNEARLKPTHADVSYGDHIRQKFDLWLPEGKSGPVPVHVFFHGGGFVGGKKTDFDPRPYLDAGFAAVSGSYRLVDGADTLGPVPMQDGARLIQTIRLNAAKWNIDPKRISVSGISAGAVIAIWIGYHDDLAQPDSDDPIARQSTRVRCIVPTNGPTNMDPTWIRANLGGPYEIHPTLPKMYGVTDGFDKPEVSARIQASNPWAMVSADDPPTLMIYARETEPMPLAATVGTSYLIHHPQFGVALKQKLDAAGIANELHTGIERHQGTILIVNWLKTQFK